MPYYLYLIEFYKNKKNQSPISYRNHFLGYQSGLGSGNIVYREIKLNLRDFRKQRIFDGSLAYSI